MTLAVILITLVGMSTADDIFINIFNCKNQKQARPNELLSYFIIQ